MFRSPDNDGGCQKRAWSQSGVRVGPCGSIPKARGLTMISLGIAGEIRIIYMYTKKCEFPAVPLASQHPTNPSISLSLAPAPAFKKL